MIDYRRFVLMLLDVVFLGALGLYVFAGLEKVPFHGDEATFVHMSQDYHILFYERDFDRLIWRSPLWASHDQYLRAMNGAINPLTIGLAWDMAGYTVTDLNHGWDWIEEPRYGWDQWAWNLRLGSRPSDDLLHVARLPSTIFCVLSIVLVYAITRRLSGSRLAAWAACLIYTTTPAVLVNGRRAMQEGAMLFSTALVMLVAIQVIREQARPAVTWRGLAGWYLAEGAVCGFAIACKHSSSVVIAAGWLVIAALPWLRNTTRADKHFLRRHKYSLVAAALVAALTVTVLMPVWWSLPRLITLLGLIVLTLAIGFEARGAARWALVGGAGAALLAAWMAAPTVWVNLVARPLDILSARDRLIEVQGERIGTQDSLRERAETLIDEAFFAGTQYYEDPPWAGFAPITAQIEVYEDAHLDGRGGGLGWGALLIALDALGALWLLARRREGTSLLMVSWLLVSALSLMMNPLPWQRYYLILHAPLAVIAGLGLCQIVGWCRAGRSRELRGETILERTKV
jgi:4-amino-4-deoxy-L-arabinose transferase-like glycosyltransferase